MAARSSSLLRLIDDLAVARIGRSFNQYRDSDGDDAGPDSPGIRRGPRRSSRHPLGWRVGAIGRLAAAALGDGIPAARHPSYGGASLCASQLRELLGERWAADVR